MDNEYRILSDSYDSLYNLYDAQSVESIIINGESVGLQTSAMSFLSTVTQIGFRITPIILPKHEYSFRPVFVISTLLTACISYTMYHLYYENAKQESTALMPIYQAATFEIPAIQKTSIYSPMMYNMKIYRLNLDHCVDYLSEPLGSKAKLYTTESNETKILPTQLALYEHALVLASCTQEMKKISLNDLMMVALLQDYSTLQDHITTSEEI